MLPRRLLPLSQINGFTMLSLALCARPHTVSRERERFLTMPTTSRRLSLLQIIIMAAYINMPLAQHGTEDFIFFIVYCWLNKPFLVLRLPEWNPVPPSLVYAFSLFRLEFDKILTIYLMPTDAYAAGWSHAPSCLRLSGIFWKTVDRCLYSLQNEEAACKIRKKYCAIKTSKWKAAMLLSSSHTHFIPEIWATFHHHSPPIMFLNYRLLFYYEHTLYFIIRKKRYF